MKYWKILPFIIALFVIVAAVPLGHPQETPATDISKIPRVPDDPPIFKEYWLTGQWIPDEDPLKIGENNFAALQNWRYTDTGLDGVRGYDNINTTALTGYLKGRSGIQLITPYDVSHIIVQAENTGLTASQIIENQTTPPSQGNFLATALHTDASGAGLGRFSPTSEGVAYCNGVESMIYAGEEVPATAFLTSTAAITNTLTNPRDYSEQVRNIIQTGDECATVGGGDDAYAKLLLHCEGTDGGTTFTDHGETGHTPSAEGDAQTDIDQKKYGDSSGLFDGTGDYLSVADHDDWAFGAAVFTIDFWVRFDALPTAGNAVMFADQRADTNNRWSFYIQNTDGTYYIKFNQNAASVMTIDITYTWTTPVVDTWYHIALIRGWGDETNDYMVTVDGTALGTASTDDTNNANFAAALTIAGISGYYYLDGWIDEFRVSKGIARWTEAFTPPVRAYQSEGLYFVVGANRPLQGVKLYIPNGGGNPETDPTLTVKEWNGASWTSLTVTDNTGGLAASGTVTWSSTVDTSQPRYLEGAFLYWYQFTLSAGNASIYHVTVNMPFQDIVDIWDTVPRECTQFQPSFSSVYKDYTLEVNAESSVLGTYAAILDSLADSDHLIVMFDDQTTAISWQIIAGKGNANASTVTVYYWDGGSWVSVGTVTDGTLDTGSTKSLTQTGVISWQPPRRSEEFPKTLFGIAGYAYKLQWSATLDDEVEIDLVTGIPAPLKIHGYEFPMMYRQRLMLCNSTDTKEYNRVDYSVTNMPDVWNGCESSNWEHGALYFGGPEALTAAVNLYNRYGSQLYEIGIFWKSSETYTLEGDGPENFSIKPLSTDIGCPAPLTVATAPIAYDVGGEASRVITLWVSYKGPMATDGSVIIPLSGIDKYFDPEKSTCINYDYITNARGWFDPTYSEYNVLIPSGSSQTTCNKWLVYDLVRKRWYEKVPATYPQAVIPVDDGSGTVYLYGFLDTGYMERLEYGSTWDGTTITYTMKTADFLLGGMWHQTQIRRLKLISQVPELDEDETVTITVKHYADGEQTDSTSLDSFVIDRDNYTRVYVNIDENEDFPVDENGDYLVGLGWRDPRYVRDTQGCNLIGYTHQFEISMTSNDYDFQDNWGKRLLGLGLEAYEIGEDLENVQNVQ